MQRLDKILSSAGAGTRKELRAAIRAGRVTVNGSVCRDESAKFDETNAQILLDGEPVELLRPALILLNKPAGYLTAADDPRQKTVMDLIPARYRRFGVMPVGRLDKDTEGLLLLTNDGNLAHRIISPKHGVWKTYYCEHDGEATAADVEAFAKGLLLPDGLSCLPAVLLPLGFGRSAVRLQEGKFHQVRRMMECRGLTLCLVLRVFEGWLWQGDLAESAHCPPGFVQPAQGADRFFGSADRRCAGRWRAGQRKNNLPAFDFAVSHRAAADRGGGGRARRVDGR